MSDDIEEDSIHEISVNKNIKGSPVKKAEVPKK